MELTFYISVFVTLFVVIDPIGLAPLYVALTTGEDTARRRAIAMRACVLSVGLLTLFGLLGEAVLGFVGISMAAFRIAGGILLFLTALEMLFERRSKRREDQTGIDRPDPSVFPLAIPLISGPGAIASMILLTGEANGDWTLILGIHVVMVLVVGVVFVLFLAAPVLERLMGKTGINVITRLLGMLLAALAVQFVLDGLRDFVTFG
jgi:multiple antibiotic resistance protein